MTCPAESCPQLMENHTCNGYDVLQKHGNQAK